VAFIEQNKRWLLPLLGVAAAGALWLNLGGPSGEDAPRAPAAGSAGRAQEDQAQAATDDLGLGPGGQSPTPVDPLKALEAPAPGANDPAPLLAAGHQAVPVELRSPPRSPELHPWKWAALHDPPVRRPAPAAPPAALVLPPPPEFLFENAEGRAAWLKGQGYRPGAVLEGGYTLKRISATGMVVAGPDGEVELPLNSARPAQPPGAAPGQPPRGVEGHHP
jgi:hypothetical protein